MARSTPNSRLRSSGWLSCTGRSRVTPAEPLYKRSLAITETALGPDQPDVGTSLNDLAISEELTAARPAWFLRYGRGGERIG
jgi:hypothetical protein